MTLNDLFYTLSPAVSVYLSEIVVTGGEHWEEIGVFSKYHLPNQYMHRQVETIDICGFNNALVVILTAEV